MLMPFLEFFQRICDICEYPQRNRSKTFHTVFHSIQGGILSNKLVAKPYRFDLPWDRQILQKTSRFEKSL